MSVSYRIYFLKSIDEPPKSKDFSTQLEVIDFLIQNGIGIVASIWKVIPSGSLCMYDHNFRHSMTSETYFKNYSLLKQYEKYDINNVDKQIMTMCD